MNATLINRFAVFLALWFLRSSAFAEEAGFAWQDRSRYRPPNFEGTYPLDAGASQRLESAVPALERGESVGEDVFELVRLGLRGLRVDLQMPALRGFGNKFIWGKSPQNPHAIELMYHASGSTNSQISYNAIYFGLSTVRPMTEPILRALVEAGMRSEDPNVLSRITWGASAQKSELLRFLQPYLESNNAAERDHAMELRRIFSGEIKAFAWAAERTRQKAEEKYSNRLDEFKTALTTGDSEKRKEALSLIQKDGVTLIMDDSFIPAFAQIATDADADVRNLAVIAAGSRWIWNATNQTPEAINLMLLFSRDPNRKVRYNANYYGLSTIRHRNEDIVSRMIEMLMQDGLDNHDFRRRVAWGLRDEKPLVRDVIEKWMNGEDQIKGLFAYGFHLDFLGEKPKANEAIDKLLENPDQTIAKIVAFVPTEGWRAKSETEFIETLRAEAPGSLAQLIQWSGNDGLPFAIVKERDGESIKRALTTSPHFKVAREIPLSAQDLISIGKLGGLKSVVRK